MIKGDKDATAMWEQIPNAFRMKILNNVFCHHCNRTQSLGDAFARLSKGYLALNGVCTGCGFELDRYIDLNSSKDFEAFPIQDYQRLQRLAAYPKGGKTARLIDGLLKLGLEEHGIWDPHDEQNLITGDLYDLIYEDVFAAGARRCWEMEQVVPGDKLDSFDEHDDPILLGGLIRAQSGNDAAIAHYKSLIEADPRCIDAYAHIGNIFYDLEGSRAITQAKVYYKKGVSIALSSIGDRVHDVFAWGFVNNRPFLRCLHGFGLCFLKKNKRSDAFAIFKHMLLLNPFDNQGVRMIISDLL